MLIGILRELHPGETRTAATPQTVGKLTKLGADVAIETGLGAGIRVPDDEFAKAGARVGDRGSILREADILLQVRKLEPDEIMAIKPGALLVCFLDPLNSPEQVRACTARGVSAVSMEYIPRTTRAQKMDALSSQANLAGYVAVILAAERLDKILPMMMTPAGTIPPAKVFVVGAGVAGLQAIATAHRLGARVEAFDTRPVVKEQVQSLGAKFVEIDLGETGQTAGGYAKELTPEQIAKQQEGMAKICASSDVVITTAQVFGRRAPVIITAPMVAGMRPGSVIVDLAVESGGNVEGSEAGKEVNLNGVTIMGFANLPGRVALNASQMYGTNVYNLMEEYWDKQNKTFQWKLEDDILKGCLIVHEGKVLNEQVANALAVAV
ncbi:MAG TPA: Re/Si-specific NAD(P)(+) transhydrogenase subunit alpha [bacterium]|nr:Re/Si-specific NAD(P)(+) transhydrogenase subunit alpha [bacterium]